MMIRQEAFIDAKKHLKGALHCHTTRSDGAGSPEAVIRLHKENGYDFMALTDHCRYNYENYAPETGMTIIPGMEIQMDLPGGYPAPLVHTHHVVCIGPERDKGNGFEQDHRIDTRINQTEEQCQALLDEVHAANNMTIYCHPEWSGVSAREFENLKGNFAMEIWNSGCAIEDGLDTNAAYWDELLVQGKKIWGVASDDGHAMSQHCNGWVRVNCENNIPAILDALNRGAFYASCGPEIYDFYMEDGVAHVKCSEVVSIQFRHMCRPYGLIKAAGGEALTGGSVNVRPGSNYIRAVVMDAEGRRAWTNPIFLED